MKMVARKLLFATVALISMCSTTARAGNVDDATGQSLKETRDRLFASGCGDFIIVQAVMDGLINDGEAYETTYTPNSVTINGVVPEEGTNKAYLKMLADFFEQQKKRNGGGLCYSKVSVQCSQLSLDKALKTWTAKNDCACKTEAAFNKRHSSPPQNITTSSPVKRIVYNTDGISVNGRQLSATEAQEYKTLYFDGNAVAPQGKSTVTVGGR